MKESGSLQKPADKFAFLSGGGEMGERVRSFDWSKTPLGSVERWPQSLKIAVRIMLDSRYAMWLGWGPELTFFYNDAYARVTLGPKHPWALGRSARDVWAEIWSELRPRVETVLEAGEATWDEGLLLFLERNGFPEETYHTFSYSPVPDEHGGIGGMLCVVTEDTERTIGERRLRILRDVAAGASAAAKSVEDSCQRAARILAGSPRDLPFLLIYLLDEAAQVGTLIAATGLAPGSGAAPRVIELSPTSIAGSADAKWPLGEVAAAGRPLVVDELTRRFGPLSCGAWPESPQQAVVLPLAKAGQLQVAGFLVAGISPRLIFNDNYKGFLELLSGHIANSIANARAYEQERQRAEALAALDRDKTAFFSNISHEFRTPLTLMLGPLEELLAHGDTQLSPAAKGQLELVNRNGLRMLRLVNTLLDFSRIEAGRVRALFQPTDLAALTTDLASIFRSACERAGLSLKVACEALSEPVFVDREMWEKIVLNLISNAFKFTFEGGIQLQLRRIGQNAELRVSDTGTGIPAEEMPRVFERFHRIENAKGRTHEGSGIGLALVLELVKLHGGSITAESVVGKGTTFVVSLPLGSAHLAPAQILQGQSPASNQLGATPFVEEALRWLPDQGAEDGSIETSPATMVEDRSSQAPAPGDDGNKSRVLVADDNADMRRYVVRLLSERFHVQGVADGAAALAAALAQPPDLILSDVMMPKLDGFGLLAKLRAEPRTQNVPVILLSARAGEESRVEGMQAGADDYLVKPFSARELMVRVTTHLQMARLRREASESLRESGERLRLALTAARMVAWEWHPSTDKLIASDNAADVFGMLPGSKLETSEHGFALLHPEDVQRHRARIYQAVEDRASYLTQFRMIRPDNGAVIWLEERGHAVCDRASDAVRLIGVVMDITDRKHNEDALRDADRRKDEFLATLAHELRNPLAPIRNGLQVMKLARNNGNAVEQSRAMMERQLGQMVRLIDDLLDVSRISRGKIELQKDRIELAKVLQQAVETSRPLIEANGNELTIDLPAEPIFVDADLTRLAQVFSNLLNNAAKYTEKGGQISLAVERQDDEAVVTIRDDGVGITVPMLARVFEMFTQVDRSLEKSQGGLGIGLSLVKGLVEMHGGSVHAHSAGQGMGSEFVVRLPVVLSVVGERTSNDAGATAAAARRRILVVDDNRDSATSLAMMLKIMGNETQTAHDGLEALDVAAAFRPDMVLLDIGMPKLNGYDTARRLREQSWGKHVVLVALTGWGQDEDRRQSQAAGFDSHMVKPIEPSTLEKLLALSPSN